MKRIVYSFLIVNILEKVLLNLKLISADTNMNVYYASLKRAFFIFWFDVAIRGSLFCISVSMFLDMAGFGFSVFGWVRNVFALGLFYIMFIEKFYKKVEVRVSGKRK